MDVFSKISTNLDSMYYFILNFKHVIPRINNLFDDYKIIILVDKGKNRRIATLQRKRL